MKRRTFVVFYAVLALAIVLLTVAFVDGKRGDEAADAPPTAQLAAPGLRVRITDRPQVSRGQDPVLLQLESGTILPDATNIMVLTDESCTPDPEGISHCLNRIQYESAAGVGQAALRHHHPMAEEPCLTPGEQLVIVTSI